MKFEIYQVKISYNTTIVNKVELECKGEGTKEAPIVMDSTLSLPEMFRIVNSSIYINIIGCKIKQLTLMSVKNAAIKNCNIRGLILNNSTHNRIQDSNLSRNLIMRNSHQNSIQSCDIKKLKLINSIDNEFKRSKIIKLKALYSKNNTYDDCIISIKAKMKKTRLTSKGKFLTSRLFLYLIFIIGSIIITIVSFNIAPLEFTLFLTLAFIAFFLFTMVLPDLLRKKRKS